MVLVMQGDGSLRASTSQSSFARNYNDGIGQGSASEELAILGDDENGVVHLTTAGELATLFGQPIPPFAGGGPNTSTAVDLNNLVSIEVSAVPLPAGFPLLLAGLGAFGWMRRRQRS